MRIDTFASTSPNVAPQHRVIARIMTHGEYLPMVLHAATVDEATEKAQAFWDAEIERAERRRMATVKRASARKSKSTDEVSHEE